jgi:hypothetical protein
MDSMTSLSFLLVLLPSIAAAQTDTLNQNLNFYPLKTGDYWEYLTITNDDGPPPKIDSSAYSVQVLGDTTLRNKLSYVTLSYQSLFPTRDSFHYFERIDSASGCVFRYDTTSPNSERRIDSIFAQQGDFFWSSPKRPGSTYGSAGFQTNCGQMVDDTILGVVTTSKFFYDQSLTESGYTLSKGLGLEWLFTYWDFGYNSGIQNNMLVYARIDGKEYGIKIPTSVIDRPTSQIGFSLSQNYPNPFNPTTLIRYRLANNGAVTLRVYDILGRLVKTLVNERQSVGEHLVTFNASNLPSGVYFYHLQAGTFTETKKLTILK